MLNALLRTSFKDRADDTQYLSIDKEGRIVQRAVPKATTELTIEQWSSAFLVFMSVFLQSHPDQTQPLLAYAELIRGAVANFLGGTWRHYDAQFRSRLEADPTHPWGVIDNQLWLTLLSKPEPILVNVKASTAPEGKKPSPRWSFFFNSRKGCLRKPCGFDHKCSRCGSLSHSTVHCTQQAHMPSATTTSSSTQGAASSSQPFSFGGQQSNN